MRESKIEKFFCDEVKRLKLGEVRKVKWLDRNGAPDRVLFLKETGEVIWIEFKAPGKELRPEQRREHARLSLLNQAVWIIDSMRGVKDFMRWL